MIVGSLIQAVSSILDKVVQDKDRKAEIAAEITKISENHAHELVKAQLEVNRIEAMAPDRFRSGWRPFIGWVCGIAFAYHFIVCPILMFFASLILIRVPEFPEFDMGMMLPVLMGMLGLGGLRTFEKYRGVSRNGK